MYAVAGASGKTGGAVASSLLSNGKDVRAIVHSDAKRKAWEERGADTAVADLTNVDQLALALSGCEGAYLMVPPQMSSNDMVATYRTYLTGYREALRRSVVRHAAFLSTWSTNKAQPFPMYGQSEPILREAPTAITFVKASYFYENTLGVMPVAAEKGFLPCAFEPDAKIPMIAAEDVGELAARLLLEGPRGIREVNVTGPQEYSMHDVAKALAESLDRSVVASKVPDADVEASLRQMGASNAFLEFFKNMSKALEAGEVTAEGGNVPLLRGGTTLKTFVQDAVKAQFYAYAG